MNKLLGVLAYLAASLIAASAQLSVSVSPPSISGNKAVVRLAMKNGLSEKVESARAAVFLFDQQGKTVGRETRWIVGGGGDKPGLAAGATNTFHFVISADKAFTNTNLTAKISVTRLVLENGKTADPHKDVQIQE